MVNNLVFGYPKPLFFHGFGGPMVAPRAIFGPLGQSCEDPGCRQVANNLPVKAQDSGVQKKPHKVWAWKLYHHDNGQPGKVKETLLIFMMKY